MRYLGIMRQRLGKDENDDSVDERIRSMSKFDRVRLICGWYLGDPEWADEFKGYCESQGLKIVSK